MNYMNYEINMNKYKNNSYVNSQNFFKNVFSLIHFLLMLNRKRASIIHNYIIFYNNVAITLTYIHATLMCKSKAIKYIEIYV